MNKILEIVIALSAVPPICRQSIRLKKAIYLRIAQRLCRCASKEEMYKELAVFSAFLDNECHGIVWHSLNDSLMISECFETVYRILDAVQQEER